MSPAVRRLALTIHVLASVAFPGAVAAFLVLAGLALGDRDAAAANYVAMEAVNAYVVVPLCWLSLFSGIICSLGTPWGLARYYWVLVKLCATMLSAAILLLHTGAIAHMAELARSGRLETAPPDAALQLVVASGLAVGVLVLLTTLSIYKPRGITPWGARSLAGRS